MKVINLIGGACTGKSTTAFGLMYFMKKMGLRVEYAGEYARDMVLEKRNNILIDQLYILAKQNRKLSRLKGEADYVVTDTSLLLCAAYPHDDIPELEQVIKAYFDSYDNLIFYLPRNFQFQFQKEGRSQSSHAEAELFDPIIEKVLPPSAIKLSVSEDYVDTILAHLGIYVR